MGRAGRPAADDRREAPRNQHLARSRAVGRCARRRAAPHPVEHGARAPTWCASRRQARTAPSGIAGHRRGRDQPRDRLRRAWRIREARLRRRCRSRRRRRSSPRGSRRGRALRHVFGQSEEHRRPRRRRRVFYLDSRAGHRSGRRAHGQQRLHRHAAVRDGRADAPAVRASSRSGTTASRWRSGCSGILVFAMPRSGTSPPSLCHLREPSLEAAASHGGAAPRQAGLPECSARPGSPTARCAAPRPSSAGEDSGAAGVAGAAVRLRPRREPALAISAQDRSQSRFEPFAVDLRSSPFRGRRVLAAALSVAGLSPAEPNGGSRW